MGPILLEGPDGGGKTTLAKNLAMRFGLHQEKNGAPTPGDDLAALYRAQLQPDTVIDRAWPSEVIYASLLSRVPMVSPHQQAALFGELREAGGRIIICLPPLFVCEKAWRGRDGELFTDYKILEKVWASYFDLAFSFRSDPKFLMIHNRLNSDADGLVYKWLEEK